MNFGDDLQNAYSSPHIAPLYPEGPYEYKDATVLALFFSIDEELARSVLPEPLELGKNPIFSLWFFEYNRTNGFGAYNELVVGINAKHDDEPLMYVVYEGLDSEIPICAGREIHGTGKKFGEVLINEHGNVHTACYRRAGVDIVTATLELEEYTTHHPMRHEVAKNAYWKRIPSASKNTLPAVDRITVSLARDITVDWAMSGPATVEFNQSAADPLYQFEPEGEVTGYLMNVSFVLDNAEDAVLHVFDEYRP